jgi:hypothetical protein
MKNLKYYSFILLSLTFLVLTSSCTSINPKSSRKYAPSPFKGSENITENNRLFILNLIDDRPESEKIPFKPEVNPLILVPLWPNINDNINPVIRYCYFQPEMTDTLQNLFITDLRVSGLFKEVTSSPFGQTIGINNIKNSKIPKNSYLLQIKITKAVWSRNLTSYGLGYVGTVLWALGAPMSYGHVALEITASLYSPKDYSKPIAEIITSEQMPCTEFVYDQMYYRPPISEIKLAQLFAKIADKLRIFLSENISP